MRPPTDMELRVAKAIADSIGGAPEVWLVSAKAAIRAMEIPTDDMLKGLAENCYPTQIWGHMIFTASPYE